MQYTNPGRHTVPRLFDQCLVNGQLAISVHWLKQRICLLFLHFILYTEALECLQKNNNNLNEKNVMVDKCLLCNNALCHFRSDLLDICQWGFPLLPEPSAHLSPADLKTPSALSASSAPLSVTIRERSAQTHKNKLISILFSFFFQTSMPFPKLFWLKRKNWVKD